MMKEKEEFLKKFGANLRDLREEKGISLREFERRCDIDRPRLSKIEQGKANPTIYTLHIICEALEVDLKTLLNKLD